MRSPYLKGCSTVRAECSVLQLRQQQWPAYSEPGEQVHCTPQSRSSPSWSRVQSATACSSYQVATPDTHHISLHQVLHQMLTGVGQTLCTVIMSYNGLYRCQGTSWGMPWASFGMPQAILGFWALVTMHLQGEMLTSYCYNVIDPHVR